MMTVCFYLSINESDKSVKLIHRVHT